MRGKVLRAVLLLSPARRDQVRVHDALSFLHPERYSEDGDVRPDLPRVAALPQQRWLVPRRMSLVRAVLRPDLPVHQRAVPSVR